MSCKCGWCWWCETKKEIEKSGIKKKIHEKIPDPVKIDESEIPTEKKGNENTDDEENESGDS